MITGSAVYFAPEEDDADEEDDFEAEDDSPALALWLVVVVVVVEPDDVPLPEEDSLGEAEVGGLLVAGGVVVVEGDGLGELVDGDGVGVGLVEWLGVGEAQTGGRKKQAPKELA